MKEHLQINWEIINTCNYQCYYCYNNVIRKKEFLNYKEIISRVLNNIYDLNFLKYSFTLTGGEPTTYKYLFYLIDHIYQKFQEKIEILNIITNGSQSLKYFENFLKYKKKNFFIRLSFHPSYVNENHFKILEFLFFHIKLIRIMTQIEYFIV